MARRPDPPSRPERLNKKVEAMKDEKKKKRNRMKSRDAAERAAYFARREAAGVLRQVLHADATRRAASSIKSLVYSPSVRNKKATFALVCQTLKYLPVIKEILTSTAIMGNKWKKQEELIYVTAYDILFGQEIAINGPVEKYIIRHKEALESALAKACVRKKVKSVEDLLPNNKTTDAKKPRFVRVNTLKINVETAVNELRKISTVKRDEMVSDLLVLPPGVDLHEHPLVLDGSVFLQGKASCMVANALSPKPGWKVIDACAAPGNKTVHLAALMKGRGNIIACELNHPRLKILQETIRRSGASNIDAVHGDFLDIDPRDPKYKKVRAILLDPSCSGSGISSQRLDHLLPSHANGGDADASNSTRIEKLAAFQRKTLEHALSFPSVERVIYSTCSVHQEENEDVVESVLPLASSLGFELASPYPEWERRGLPAFEGSKRLLRTDPSDGMEGFFIALFVRETQPTEEITIDGHNFSNRIKCLGPPFFPRMSKTFLYYASQIRRTRKGDCTTCDSCSSRICC